MDVDTPLPSRFERLPVFPLPDTVLFPGTVLPLHIFEPRYREMIADVLEDDGVIAVVMLEHAAKAADSRPPLHQVACAGKIIHSEALPDGRYNILLQGTSRVRLIEEVDTHLAYRRFRAETFPELDPRAMEHASLELGRLQSCVLSLTSLVEKKDAQLVEVLRATDDPVKLADILSAAVVSDSALQQRLLSTTDLRDRLTMLVEALAEVMVRVSDPVEQMELN